MDTRVKELLRRGLFLEAEAHLQASGSASPSWETETLRAELAERLGKRDEASRITSRLLRDSTLEPHLRVRALIVAGQVALDTGMIQEAIRLLQEAVSVAKAHNCSEELCWAELRLVTAICESPSAASAQTVLADLRRHVAQVGVPFVSVSLHVLVSELEAKRGAFASARRHIRVARSLLEREENVWLEAVTALADMCEAMLSSNMDRAFHAARVALETASRSGHAMSRLAANSNFGHYYLSNDQLGRAQKCFEEAWRISRSSPRIHSSILDGLAQVALAQGDVQRAEELLVRAAEMPLDRKTYTKRWVGFAMARLLARTARWHRAAEAARELLDISAEVGDRHLAVLARLVLAESRAALGDHIGAAVDIENAISGQDPTLDVLAETQRVLGRALAFQGDLSAARAVFDRSHRILGAIGHIRAQRDVDQQRKQEGLELLSTPDAHAARADLLITRLAATLQQAGRADLLGAEAMDVLLEAGIAGRVAIIARSQSKVAVHRCIGWSMAEARAAARTGASVLRLGILHQAEWLLLADIHLTVAARAAWLALQTIVNAGVELAAARAEAREREALWPIESADEASHGVFRSEQMLELLRITRRIAATDVTVLLTGETGAGKEVLARVLHDASPRAAKPFVPLNCSAVPRDMLEAQLFGHRRGAFTGADSAFPGVLRAAAGGTVFLDEIGEISLDLQPKLLRFLESGEVHPLGETQPVKVNVRVLAATNQDLDRLVREGRFREDLYYRLNVIHLRVPPLRERREEIPLLVQHFLERFAREFNKGRLRLADETMEYFVLHAWPGNVRQLANELRRLAALAEQDAVLMPEHLSPALAATRRTRPASERDLMPTELVVRLDQPLAAATEHLERAMIQHAMALCHGRVDQVARTLGLSRKGLYLKRRRLKLDAPAGV